MNRITLAALAATLLVASSCYVPTPQASKTEIVTERWEPAGAESLTVALAVGVGTLKVAGGAEAAAEASVSYNIPDWKPVMSYEASDGLGRLDLSQPSSVVGVTWPGSIRYDWNVRLGDSLPTRLEVKFGAGNAELDLRGIDLRRLSVDAGAGEGRLDLSGPRRAPLSVAINAGVGRLVLVLPRATPVAVSVEGGIGDVSAPGLARRDGRYVNDAGSGPAVEVNIKAGIGSVILRLAEEPGEII